MGVNKTIKMSRLSGCPASGQAGSVGKLVRELYGNKVFEMGCFACPCCCSRPSPHCEVRAAWQRNTNRRG